MSAELHEAEIYFKALQAVSDFAPADVDYQRTDDDHVQVRVVGRCPPECWTRLTGAFEATKRMQAKNPQVAFDLSRVYLLMGDGRFGYFWRVIASYPLAGATAALNTYATALHDHHRRSYGKTTVTTYPLVGAQAGGRGGKGGVPLTLSVEAAREKIR
jgi:hypothetical protein